MKRIYEFDGLRTLAVLIVIADHYAPFRNFENSAPARLGGIGVDIFFVLSGFLITTILLELKGSERPYQVFYARRMLRILPPYVLLLVLVYGIGFLLHEPFEKTKVVGQVLFLRSFKDTGAVLATVWNVLRGIVPAPGLFHKIVSAPVLRDYPWLPISGSLGPTWSLSVEEWFYVLWAPVVLIFRRRVIFIIAVFVCVTGFILRWLGGNATEFFSSVDILISGAILALWIERRKTVAPGMRRSFDLAIATLSSLAFLSYVLLTWLHRDRISRTLVAIFVFGALAWIIQRAGQKQAICRLLRVKPMVYLGTISYTIYLMHLPMYFLIRSALFGPTSSWSPVAQAWAVAVCSAAATVGLAALSWKYYELPILGFKDALTRQIKEPRAAPRKLQTVPSVLPASLPTDSREQING